MNGVDPLPKHSRPLFSCHIRLTLSRSHQCATRDFDEQEKYYQADECFLRAIDIGEKVLGPVHPDLAIWLGSRGTLLHIQVPVHICWLWAQGCA